MGFPVLDQPRLARALSSLLRSPEEMADAYFEQTELVEVPPPLGMPGLLVTREEGLSVRFVDGEGRTWLASRDRIDTEQFEQALRRVARTLPARPALLGSVAASASEGPQPGEEGGQTAARLLDFRASLERRVIEQRPGLSLRVTVRAHRRWLQVIGSELVPEPEQEAFYSCTVELPQERLGFLLTDLGAQPEDRVASEVLERSLGGDPIDPASPRRPVVVLGPAATAVLLHEAVAHGLEADLLALTGRPEAALGLPLGSPLLDLLDDPGGAPPTVRRTTDDEGMPVLRRWLLRQGRVEQLLADRLWSRSCTSLEPGAGRRSGRRLPPLPRSTHLELLPGQTEAAELLSEAEGGLYAAAARSGRLDPLSGRCTVELTAARRIEGGRLGRPVGSFTLAGSVAELLGAVVAVGSECVPSGAGWCAKGGQSLPVWATAPALRLEGIEVSS